MATRVFAVLSPLWLCLTLTAHAQSPVPTPQHAPALTAYPQTSATSDAPAIGVDVAPIASTLEAVHARRVLRALSERERHARYAGAYAKFFSGAAAISAGLVADLAYDRAYGTPLWVLGALVVVDGFTNLLGLGPLERFARIAQGYTPEQLQAEWSRSALSARHTRHVGGVISLALGALTIGTGAAIAAGLGGLGSESKQDWTTLLIGLGGASMGSGLVSLLVESRLESSYQAAYGSDADGTPLALSVAPTRGGAALCLRANF